MKKAVVISAVVLILVIAAYAWIALTQSGAPVPPPNGGSSPVLPVASSTAGSTDDGAETSYSLAASDGGVVVTNAFLTAGDAYPDPVNSGYYSLGVPLSASSTARAEYPFMVMYVQPTNLFIIELTREPLGESRTAAQFYLQQRLGITQTALCRLNYTLSVSVNVNADYAGKNLGFSGCPGATKLP